MKLKKAIETINRKNILLVFPINNKKEPDSLWNQFYPRQKMSWSWDEEGDHRVADMWRLMKKLSDGREVVYSKWYQGRATFFSRALFTALLALKKEQLTSKTQLSRTSLNILEILENDSPISTKQLKKFSELQGKDNEKYYQRAMKQLFSQFHVVAFGEVDDGAFPSLAVGSTKNLFEDLWNESQGLDLGKAFDLMDKAMPVGSLFRKFFDRV